MLKKTITYENPFSGETVTETHYFHISKADLVEMEMEEHKAEYTNQAGDKLTGMQAKLQRIVDSEDGKAIMDEFKDIIRRSYGQKQGDRFLKSKAIWDEFASTEAFSQLLFEICTDASAAASFVNGVVPSNLEQIADEVRTRAAEAQSTTNGTETPAQAKIEAALAPDDEDAAFITPRVITLTEAAELDQDELQSGLATGRYKLS
jgi:hypothetical protein